MRKLWLIVDETGKFWLTDSYSMPEKVTKEIMETDYDNYEWDYHGHHIYGEKGTGKFKTTWNVFVNAFDTNTRTYIVSKDILDPKYKNRTWDDEPLLLSEHY